ncbi:MAG: STAS domain-containing protein [Leptospiraceae bacterium]|nr:STAS domain-containing protein [Leptospiraceae bacterium]MCP5513297.1 STAS domain-containing protein [Leptospiraceae bacterium]
MNTGQGSVNHNDDQQFIVHVNESKIQIIIRNTSLDYNSTPAFHDIIDSHIDKNLKEWEVDFSGVVFLDSSGLGLMARLSKVLDSQKSKLIIKKARNEIVILLLTSGFTKNVTFI